MRNALTTCVIGVGLALATGCSGSPPPPDDGNSVEPWVIPLIPNRALDVLFVIDNSGSMAGEQASLAANFPSLVNVLETIPGGLPDVHIGVVSSNVGAAGQASVPGCSGQGDDGNLLVRPSCDAPSDPFISDVADPGGGRTRNYAGDLASQFACMAQLGTGGCGFEMHLESMYRALQPGKNPGFLRPDAHLAVVIIADEDDCSTELGAMFGDPTASLTSPLGPRTSFRCHEFGVECDDDPDPRAFGTRTGCRPRANSPYMFEIERYVDLLASLKQAPAQVMVAGILGIDDAMHTVTVGADPHSPTFPSVERSCFLADPNDPEDGAAPPIRTAELIRRVGTHHNLSSICEPDLELPLTDIGLMIKRAIRDPCLRRPLRDTDAGTPGVQYQCSVLEVTEAAGNTRLASEVPVCDEVGPRPCWRFAPNLAECPDVPGNLAVDVDRAGAAPPPDTVLEVRCAFAD